ncbi:MAG: leucine-rich repeat domain-containing protein, partial [Candidatus Coproplasma sp.]
KGAGNKSGGVALYIGENVEAISDDLFVASTYSILFKSIKFADNCKITDIGDYAFSGTFVSDFTGTEYGNCIYAGTTANPYMVLFAAKSTDITEATIHQDTKYIYTSAFYDCASLAAIEIPEGVEKIYSNAFSYCTSLTSFKVPASVKFLGRSILMGCTSLTNLEISKLTGWKKENGESVSLTASKDMFITYFINTNYDYRLIHD